jgi:catechol 2,3-dioxygenase-like lactoylglutathione lyase family enzyme
MKPRITMLTLGVDDLERSVKFYRDGLGFHLWEVAWNRALLPED